MNKTKRDLLIYYAAVSDVLIPHLRNRGLVLTKHPNGVEGEAILIKKIPAYRPEWLPICLTVRSSGKVTETPMVQDLASLLWIINLGCIDLCHWPVRCDDRQRPDYVHFDLIPIPPAEFPQTREAALLLHDFLQEKNVSAYAKTTGSQGIHVYVPIYRKPSQREVWQAAKWTADTVARKHPALLTSERIIKKRAPGKVFIAYNQNAGAYTLSSAYSLYPGMEATVSAPVAWEELKAGVNASDFTIDSVPSRVEKIGDLFRPLVLPASRYPLGVLLS